MNTRNREAVKKYLDENLPRLEGFAAFDDAKRISNQLPKRPAEVHAISG
jgi:hypothetical protein